MISFFFFFFFSIFSTFSPACDSSGSVVYIRLTQHIHTRLLIWPFRRYFTWEMIIRLKLKTVKNLPARPRPANDHEPLENLSEHGVTATQSKKYIDFQEDAFVVESLFHPIPGISWFYSKIMLKAVAVFISISVVVAVGVLKRAETTWNFVLEALGADVNPPKAIREARVTVKRVVSQH